MTAGTPFDGSVRLRPFPSIFWRALAATAVFLVPVGAVLYYLTVPDGPWMVVLVMTGIAFLLFAVASHRFFRVGIWVSPHGISERGFFSPLVHVDASVLHSALIVDTFHGPGTETVPQFFLCDDEGRKIVRMRGQFWSRADMMTTCAILDLPLTEVTETITRRELLSRYPGLLYSFERHPVIAAAVFSSVILAVGVVLFALLSVLGVPLQMV